MPGRNGLTLQVNDARRRPLVDARVYLYPSAALARTNQSAGSVAQPRTDHRGQVELYNLAPGRYYVRIIAWFKPFDLTTFASLEVRPATVASKTIQFP